MTALSDLATEVRFRERLRGYDYDEVDSYVRSVAEAAAEARDRIALLEQQLTHLSSRDSSDEGANEARETLLRTLVLAQRTADTAIAEARAEARTITESAAQQASEKVAESESTAVANIRAAEEAAASIRAEADESCRLIIAETKRTAAAEMASERERRIREIQSLDATKNQMQAELASIHSTLNEQRLHLHSVLAAFQSFIDQIDPAPRFEHFHDTGAGGAALSPQASAQPAQLAAQLPDAAPMAKNPADSSETQPSEEPVNAVDDELADDADSDDTGADDSDTDAGDSDTDADTDAGDADTGDADIDGSHDSGDAGDSGGVASVDDLEEPLPGVAETDQDAAFRDGTDKVTSVAEDSAVEPGSLAESGYLDDLSGQAGLEADGSAETQAVPEVPVVRWLDEGDDSGEETQRHDAVPAADSESSNGRDAEKMTEQEEPEAPAAHLEPEPLADGESPDDASDHIDAREGDDADQDVAADEDQLEEEDEFLEQLRKVVNSQAPAAASEEAMAAFFDHDENASRGGMVSGHSG